MRKALTERILVTVAAMLVSGAVGAGKDATKDPIRLAQLPPEEKKAESTPMAAITYKAPLRGAPATRVGGGTRSLGTKPMTVLVLAPNETGYTTRDKPTLYWYVSQPLEYPVELTLISLESLDAASKPAVELKFTPPTRSGVHALSLAEHNVALKPGVEYQWFVAAVGNPAQRSNDVVAGGTIKLVAESDAVRARIKEVPAAGRPALYAGEGIWYDAIDELSRLIAIQPANLQLREQRAALLEQVGLAEAAAFDRAALR
jgi:hypothetical protein